MGAGHDHGPGVAEAGQPGDYRRKLWIAFGIPVNPATGPINHRFCQHTGDFRAELVS